MFKSTEVVDKVDGDAIVATFRVTAIKKIVVTAAVCAGVAVVAHVINKKKNSNNQDDQD